MTENEYTKRVNDVIGHDLIADLSEFKFHLLAQAYNRLHNEKLTIENISNEEILWVFNMVKDNLIPNDYSKKISESLGYERLTKVSLRQARFLDKNYDEEIQNRTLNEISSERIIGIYELITEDVAPIEIEMMGGYYEENNELYIYY